MNKEQKSSVENFVDWILDRRDIDLSQRVDKILIHVDDMMARTAKVLGNEPDKNNYAHTLSRLDEAEYACNFMKQRLSVASLGYLQRKLDAEISKIESEKQKVYDLWESPGTYQILPEITKAVAADDIDLATTLDENRKDRANFLTTAQFGQSLPNWPTEARKDPDNVKPEYKHLFE